MKRKVLKCYQGCNKLMSMMMKKKIVLEVTSKRAIEGSNKLPPNKKRKQQGAIDMYITEDPEDAIKGRKDGKGGRQQTLMLRDKVISPNLY